MPDEDKGEAMVKYVYWALVCPDCGAKLRYTAVLPEEAFEVEMVEEEEEDPEQKTWWTR